jgi:hypothetical protein
MKNKETHKKALFLIDYMMQDPEKLWTREELLEPLRKKYGLRTAGAIPHLKNLYSWKFIEQPFWNNYILPQWKDRKGKGVKRWQSIEYAIEIMRECDICSLALDDLKGFPNIEKYIKEDLRRYLIFNGNHYLEDLKIRKGRSLKRIVILEKWCSQALDYVLDLELTQKKAVKEDRFLSKVYGFSWKDRPWDNIHEDYARCLIAPITGLDWLVSLKKKEYVDKLSEAQIYHLEQTCDYVLEKIMKYIGVAFGEEEEQLDKLYQFILENELRKPYSTLRIGYHKELLIFKEKKKKKE